MRKLLLILNGLVALFFLSFFVYTFVSREHIALLARDFVTVKTQKFAEPVVALAEQTIKMPLVVKILLQSRIAAIQREIDDYRRDPVRYIAELTGHHSVADTGEVQNAVLTKITGWKDKVRQHYDRILGRLVWDLRIFAGSNAAAAILAMAVAYRATDPTAKRTLWVSLLLLGALAYSIYFYIDRFSFFKILFNSYLGWWYPALLAITFLALHLEFAKPPDDQED